MSVYLIKIGDLEPFPVSARNRRSAINKTLEEPDQVAIVQTHAMTASLFRINMNGLAVYIGKIWEAKE